MFSEWMFSLYLYKVNLWFRYFSSGVIRSGSKKKEEGSGGGGEGLCVLFRAPCVFVIVERRRAAGGDGIGEPPAVTLARASLFLERTNMEKSRHILFF